MGATRAFLGLGSNVGDKENNIQRAVALLGADKKIRVVRTSSIYRTQPWGYLEQDWFLNAVIEVETMYLPRELLGTIKETERKLKRVDTGRWGPRTIDIDILLYGSEIVDEPDLQIPHRFLTQRAFVLVPLAEIAPDVRAARLQGGNGGEGIDDRLTVKELLIAAGDGGGVEYYGPFTHKERMRNEEGGSSLVRRIRR